MKLISLAALFFRILGVCGIIDGLFELTFHNAGAASLLVNGITVIGSGALIWYSKTVARLFCRGLDDDAC
jgi:hypothetical protein